MIRFQADADLNQAILLATVRRFPRLDFQSATDAGLAGLTDLEVLTLASEQGRILSHARQEDHAPSLCDIH